MSRNEFSVFQSFLFFFLYPEFLAFHPLLSPFFHLPTLLLPLSLSSVAGRVPVIVGHLNELVDHIQQVVVVFVQQPLV